MNEDGEFYYINAITGKPSDVPLYLDKEQAEILNQAADEAGLTGDLRKSFFTTVFIESGKTMTKEINGKKVKVFTPDVNAVSSAGAKGAFQFMPITAAELDINPLDFKESAFASAKYIKSLFEIAVQRGEKDPIEAASVYYNRGQRDGYQTGTKLDKELKEETKSYIQKKKLNSEAATQVVNSTLGLVDDEYDANSEVNIENKNRKVQSLPKTIVSNKLDRYKPRWDNPLSKAIAERNLTKDSKYFEDGGSTQSTQDTQADKQSLITPQGIMNTASSVLGDVSKLNDGSKRNNAEAIGGIIGTAVDTTAMAFGIPTFGLGNKAGTVIGEQFANKAMSNPNSFYKTGFRNGGRMKNCEDGGQINTKAVEIEKDEYVFNPNGLDESKFKMTNSLGNKFKSKVGFLVDGDTHNNGGIEVIEGDAYIASNHLGVDGKKATSKNKSVAKLMLQQGGKVLAQASDYDKFSVSKKNTPNAYNYIINNMQTVADKAETNKKIEEQIKQINNQMNKYKSNPLSYTYKPELSQYMEDGGMMQDPSMMQQAAPQAVSPQEQSIMDQIPPEQQEQVMQMAQAAMQGDKQAMQQLVEMLGEEGVQMLMQELQSGSQGQEQQQQQPANPSNQAAMQAMSQAPAAMMQNGGYMKALTQQYAKKYLG